jgi:hypothetical protein
MKPKVTFRAGQNAIYIFIASNEIIREWKWLVSGRIYVGVVITSSATGRPGGRVSIILRL